MSLMILKLENDSLRFELHEDSSSTILDKHNGAQWNMGPVAWEDVTQVSGHVVWPRQERVWADYEVCRFRLRKLDNGSIRVGVIPPPWRDVVGSFTAKWELEGRTLLLRVEEIDDSFPSLNYPPPIHSESLVIPDGVGLWEREAPTKMEAISRSQNSGLNMRWIGGLAENEDSGWMMLFEDGFEDSGVYQTGRNVMPTWFQSMNQWSPTRSVRYHFTSGGYVSMAKLFRSYAQEQRIFRTLEEKLEETPALRSLVGGRTISFYQAQTHHKSNDENFFAPITPEMEAMDGKVEVLNSHADVAEAIRLAKEWGMNKGVFSLRGTFKGGYDELHPDIWPPEPALGSIGELQSIIDQDDAYLVVLHDNYQDMYPHSPSFPKGIIKTPEGKLMQGGHWQGGLCYIICSKEQLRYTERNWENVKSLNLRGYFADTIACVRFYECYDPEHPINRRQDRENKLELMKSIKNKGLVLGSEEASDFALYYIDFLENRHTHTPGKSVPLWPLVFHDAAIYSRYTSNGTSGGDPAEELETALWGYAQYWACNTLEDWRSREQAFKASLSYDELHARLATSEMLNHRYLGEDRLVEQTEFSCGISVLANFSGENRRVDSTEVPAQSYRIVE